MGRGVTRREVRLGRDVRPAELVGDLAGEAIDGAPVPAITLRGMDGARDGPFGEMQARHLQA